MARLTGKVALITGAPAGRARPRPNCSCEEGAVVLTDIDTAAGLASLCNQPRDDFAAGRN